MIVSAYQPYFAPFPGFFYKALRSDVLVVMDSVQFPQGTTWLTRNRFKNHQGTLWMTVPVWKKGLGRQNINEVRICHEGQWKRKHLESLKTAYVKAPFFTDHTAFLENVFSEEHEKLADSNIAIIKYVLDQLEIPAEVVLLSDLDIKEKEPRLTTEICRKLGASRFIAQRGARQHLDEASLRNAGIEPVFFAPPSPVYPQLWGTFIPNLSVFDLLFTCGPQARAIIEGE